MTRNQILKSQLYETAAHNRAMESIAAGELSERKRSNRASEANSAEYNRIKQQRYNAQSAIEQYRANVENKRVEYDRMHKMQDFEQRQKEWSDSMSKFYKQLAYDYRRMEVDESVRRDDIATKIYRNDVERNKVRIGAYTSMQKGAIEGLKIAVPILVGATAGPAAGGAAAIAAKLFKN